MLNKTLVLDNMMESIPLEAPLATYDKRMQLRSKLSKVLEEFI
jgi:hypothetical protein